MLEIEEYGTYYLRAIATDNEEAVSDSALLVITVEDIGTAVDQISKTRVSLFPNPAKDRVVFSVDGLKYCERMHVEIRDVSGKLVFKSEYETSSRAIIPLSNLVSGAYSFSAEICNAMISETLIINR
ncbi:MAG: T9SS C-terminal target domain-containing protein [Saprospirales bacterium]|nr:MAG: T9SS C-terminal target domain-containing protein [Saprospirales bacterium]